MRQDKLRLNNSEYLKRIRSMDEFSALAEILMRFQIDNRYEGSDSILEFLRYYSGTDWKPRLHRITPVGKITNKDTQILVDEAKILYCHYQQALKIIDELKKTLSDVQGEGESGVLDTVEEVGFPGSKAFKGLRILHSQWEFFSKASSEFGEEWRQKGYLMGSDLLGRLASGETTPQEFMDRRDKASRQCGD